MTKLCVAIFAETVEAALAQAAVAAERGADMVEYRLDRFAEPPDRAAELVQRSPLPCIVTCRPKWEGGEFEGDEAARVGLLESAGYGLPAYLDWELAAADRHTPLSLRFGMRPGLDQVLPLTITHITGGRVSSLPADRRMKIAKRWALDNIRGTHTNADTGWEIIVSGEGAKEAAGKSPDPARLDAIEAIPLLIERGVLVRTHPDEYGRKGIVAVHRLYSALRIGSSLYAVKLTVFEHSDGRKFYNHDLVRKIKEAPAWSPPPAGEPSDGAQADASATPAVQPGTTSRSTLGSQQAGADTISIDKLVPEIKRSEMSRHPRLILSSHDFQGRPADLLRRIQAMARDPWCRVIKVAWRARSLRDNLEAFELLRQRPKPMIALCMGEFGLPSRVLAKKYGALLTFAGLDDEQVTAPGQVGVEAMKRLYRWDAIDADTKVYGVIGWPVGHSLSPHVHNAGFDAAGHNGVYLPLPIPPEWEHFKATLIAFLDDKHLGFRGASVTIPHKAHLLRFVKEQGGGVEPLAERIGAANTLTVRDDGTLYASNTDYAAALDAVCEAMGIAREGLSGTRVAVIGAGGAARAVVAAFAHYGATVVIYNRTPARAAALADEFDGNTGRVVSMPWETLNDEISKAAAADVHSGIIDPAKIGDRSLDKRLVRWMASIKSPRRIVVNCTPIGMSPDTDATPIPDWPASLGKGTLVFDTIYNPVETKLLRDAAAAGCKTVSGVEMFVRQAAGQFQLWTGHEAPIDIFRRIVRERLKG